METKSGADTTPPREDLAKRGVDYTTASAREHVHDLLDAFLPDSFGIPLPKHERLHGGIELLLDLDVDHEVLSPAVLALAFAMRARSGEGDVDLQRASMSYYRTALQRLRSKVSNAISSASVELLMACILLSIYEIYEVRSHEHYGWLLHCQGMSHLLLLQRPSDYALDLYHELFQLARLSLIYTGITLRKGTFIAQAQWMEEPWLGRSKSEMQKLFDFTAQLPGLLEKVDIFHSGQSENAQSHPSELFGEINAIHSALETWSAAQGDMSPKVAQWQRSISPNTHIITAHAMVLYWAARIIVFGALGRVISKAAISSPRHNDDLVEFRQSACDAARSIVESIPYFLDPKRRILGGNLVSFQLGIACTFYKHQESSRLATDEWREECKHAYLMIDAAFRVIDLRGIPSGNQLGFKGST